MSKNSDGRYCQRCGKPTPKDQHRTAIKTTGPTGDPQTVRICQPCIESLKGATK